jgi:hypothetical protein
VLDLWPVSAGDPTAAFTTVMNWSSIGEHEHEGQLYGEKPREFAPFLHLPQETGERMEIAINARPEECERIARGGWKLVNALKITRTPWSYQDYIKASLAEFSVARHGYVSTQCGWFSDRSSAYLAMGRPVVLQDTGFSAFLPSDAGLLAYRTREEALAAIQQVHAHYAEHCRAARAVAEEYFDAQHVLTDLLAKCV